MAQQIKTKFIEDLAITTAKIAAGSITGAKIESSVALAGVPTAATAAFGTSTTQIATTSFVQAALSAADAGLKPKQAVRAASSTNIVLASALINGSTVGGVTVATGDRVLLYGQTAPAENGIYIVAASGAASRSTDFDSLTPVDEINRAWVPVQEGTHSGKVYVQYGTVTTLGTDAITFTFYDPIASLVGGDMINVSGSTISVALATNGGLESTNPGNAAGELRIKLSANESGLKLDSEGLKIKLYGDLNQDGVAYGLAIDAGDGGLYIAYDGITLNVATEDGVLEVKDFGITNAKIADGTIDLTTKVTGVLPTDSGGTGLSAAGAVGNVLTSDGSVWTSAAPAAVYQWGKETNVLDSTDITNGYVDLAFLIQQDSLVAFVGRLAMHKTEDYTFSTVSGKTRVTFAGSLATGQAEALVAGDTLFFTYQY